MVLITANVTAPSCNLYARYFGWPMSVSEEHLEGPSRGGDFARHHRLIRLSAFALVIGVIRREAQSSSWVPSASSPMCFSFKRSPWHSARPRIIIWALTSSSYRPWAASWWVSWRGSGARKSAATGYRKPLKRFCSARAGCRPKLPFSNPSPPVSRSAAADRRRRGAHHHDRWRCGTDSGFRC
jgi:hypothetical protein